MTVPEPTNGGRYVEAYVGQPRFINPLIAASSSDLGLSKLIYASLFTYDQNGLLRPDLAERFEMREDAKEMTVYLRKDITWHDGEMFNADDVLYTTGIMQDIAYGAAGVSTDLRLIWQNIGIEKKDDHTIVFSLQESDGLFAHNLTFGVLPEHVWAPVNPEQFQLAEYNQKPIGNGPYEFVDVNINDSADLIDSYVLRAYENYHHGEPFITKFVANFYSMRSDAVSAYAKGEVSSVLVDKREHIDLLAESANKKSIDLPHYFAVFFNQTKSVPLAYDEVREAIARATNRDQIISDVFGGNAQVRRSPFFEGFEGYDGEKQQPAFDRDSAKVLLEEKGWKVGEDGIRSKGDDRLSVLLHVSDSHEQFLQIAEILKEQWKEIGIELNVQTHTQDDLEKNILKPRDYDAVLHAHRMRFEPNILPLWHSSEKNDPGMNYALFANDKMDDALSGVLKTSKVEDRKELYEKQQELLRDEVPALFLFAPKISFMHSDAVKGIAANRVNVSYDRYVNVHSWYIKEKRVKK